MQSFVKIPLALLALLLLALPGPALAGWLDTAKDMARESVSATSSGDSSGGVEALSTEETVSGLKQALEKAVRSAISSLGQPGGYLENAQVRIPMPENLRTAEQAARAVGQGELADEFIASMNEAAEEAVPETVTIFTEAIKRMSFSDAKAILTGPDDAATSYFRQNSSAALYERILPIVEKATDSVGVTSRYKSFMGGANTLGATMGMETTDLDGYVTNEAIEGLFTVMAQEEKAIRENPAQRTTDLLKKVFGAAQ